MIHSTSSVHGSGTHRRRPTTVTSIMVGSSAFALLLGGCSSAATTSPGDETATTSPGDETGDALDIRFVSTYNGLPFYTATLCGMEAAADELGGDISITMDGPSVGMNVAQQTPVLQAAISAGPDGMVVVPADPTALNPLLQQAVDEGIALATTDVTLTEEIELANFATDNFSGGELAGEEMVRLLDEAQADGPILVIDIQTGLPVTNARAEGFVSVVEEAGYSVLPIQYNQNDPTTATTIVQATLQANPDLAGIFVTAESAANGAVAGLQNAGEIKVVAYDSGPVLVRAIKDGVIDATIGQGSFDQGYGALTAVVNYLRDGTEPESYLNVVPNMLITSDNVDDPEIVERYQYPESCG